jgi:LysR family transcriptional regulator, glycine cleavage system transcriptional activator
VAYRLPPLPALRAFEAAARHLSFKKAATELHVTPAAISQQIKALEHYLGVGLFRRLTRSLELTEQGSAMQPKVRAAFDCLAAAVDCTRRESGGALNVTAPPSFATRWLVPRLARFAAAHPDIELRLSSSHDTIDRRDNTAVFDDGLIDPRCAASEIAIRYGTGDYPGCRVEQVFTPDYVPVCSPRLMAERPLDNVIDLREHVLIHDETTDGEERQPNWREWLKLAGVNLDAGRGPRFSNAVMAVEAALDGQGVALASKPLIESDVAAGRLCLPFDLAMASPYGYYLVMPEALAERSSVVAFRNWLLAEA